MTYENLYEKELNHLFSILKRTKSSQNIQEIEERIWNLWMDSHNPQVNVLMEQGNKLLAEGNYTDAIRTFAQVTYLMPSYPEGWNKRATAYYLRGDYKASLDDIKIVISLEKRHFGALYGRANIYLSIGYDKGALRTYEQLAQICPHRNDVKRNLKSLRNKIRESEA